VWIDTRSALEGCVIAENRVTTSSGLGLNGGGGAYVTRATELRDCVVRDNISSENGGGAWIARGSPVLERCRILRNQARAGGGLQFRPVAQPQIGGTVRSCLIADNFARAGGGVWHDSAPAEGAWFIDTIFVDNIMSEDGPDGPVNVPATAGGAFRLFYGEPRLVGCVFVGNAAHGRDECTEGGALGFADLTSSDGQIAWLANCTFAGNRVELLEGAPAGQVLRGGAMNVLGAGFLANCRFVGNSAGDGLGGALSNAGTCALANSLFARNDATAIVNDASASPLRLANAVLWANVRAGNLMDQAAQLQGPAQIDYSCVQGWDGSLGGEGNIGADPLFAPPIAGLWTGAATYDPNAVQTTFVDAAAAFSSNTLAGRFINPDNEQTLQSVIVSNTATTITVWGDFAALGAAGVGYAINDYRLTSESPLIDAASNFAVPADALDLDGDGDSNEPTPVDLHGCPRFLDDPGRPDSGAGSAPLVDMGPLEYNACPADLDGDGVVGILDLATILSNYGRIGNVAPCDGDLDGSGEIDLIDLGGLLSAFGSSCP